MENNLKDCMGIQLKYNPLNPGYSENLNVARGTNIVTSTLSSFIRNVRSSGLEFFNCGYNIGGENYRAYDKIGFPPRSRRNAAYSSITCHLPRLSAL